MAIVTDLPRAELVQAYLNSDLFVFASHVEYSPLVLYEAAAAGLPFLTVPVGNSAEIAEWTGGGVVCPAPKDERGYTKVDPAVLAENITSLAADPARLAALGQAGHRAWSERFTWDKIVDRYEAMFADLVGKAGS
jgi:glycosyltransferase involved in cell wall biosynthesis